MKELNNFRQFLAEGQINEGVSPEALIKVFQDEIVAAKANEEDDIVPAFEKGIEMLKQGVLPEKVNDTVQGMYIKITGDYSYDPAEIMIAAREIDAQRQLNEGTWSLGTVAEMVKVMGKLEQIRKMGAAKGGIELENLDRALYNVFGDDSFHDALDAAKDTDDDDRFNNFIGDAQARARELYRDELRDAKEQGETGFEQALRFGLEENDAVLDEIIGEEKKEVNENMQMFREIDDMLSRTAIHMNASDFVDELVQEFEAISGGPKKLHQALKNIVLNNNIPEADFEKDSAIIKKMNKR